MRYIELNIILINDKKNISKFKISIKTEEKVFIF